MDFTYINIHQICSIEGRCLTRSNRYEYIEYQPKKGPFGFGKLATKEGFYENGFGGKNLSSVHEIEQSGYFVIGKKVFIKPFIKINMSNKEQHKKIFNSNIDMFEFLCNSPLSKLDVINARTPIVSRNVLLEKYQGYSDEFRILLKNSIDIADS